MTARGETRAHRSHSQRVKDAGIVCVLLPESPAHLMTPSEEINREELIFPALKADRTAARVPHLQLLPGMGSGNPQGKTAWPEPSQGQRTVAPATGWAGTQGAPRPPRWVPRNHGDGAHRGYHPFAPKRPSASTVAVLIGTHVTGRAVLRGSPTHGDTVQGLGRAAALKRNRLQRQIVKEANGRQGGRRRFAGQQG